MSKTFKEWLNSEPDRQIDRLLEDIQLYALESRREVTKDYPNWDMLKLRLTSIQELSSGSLKLIDTIEDEADS